jgi:hypothetical protein
MNFFPALGELEWTDEFDKQVDMIYEGILSYEYKWD